MDYIEIRPCMMNVTLRAKFNPDLLDSMRSSMSTNSASVIRIYSRADTRHARVSVRKPITLVEAALNMVRTVSVSQRLSDYTAEFRWLLAAFLVLTVAGCTTLGPDYKSPEALEADKWLDQDNTDVKTDSVDLKNWWKVFNDPVLDELIDKALGQNPSLQVAGLRILEARAQLGIAKGSLYPQSQSVFGSAQQVGLSENIPISSLAADDSYSLYQAGFDVGWELDFWGRFRRGLEAADANLQASVSNYQEALVTLTAEVARTYVNIRIFEDRIRLAENNIELQQRSLRIAEVRFRNGATTALDVEQAKSNLANTQALLPQLRQGLRQSKNSLSILLGLLPGEIDGLLGDGPGVIPVPPQQVAIGLPAELLRRRPDVRRAEYVAAIESARIGIARTELYPHFSLFGSIGFQSSDAGESNDLFSSKSLAHAVGAGFSWDILNYGRLKNNVRAQDAVFQQALVRYQDTVLQAYREAEDGVNGFLETQVEVEYRDASATAALRSVRLANTQYREGAVDFQRVVDSERFLVQQQDQLVKAKGDIVLNLVSTYKALGGGWEVDEDHQIVPEATLQIMRERTDWGDMLPAEDLPDGQAAPVPAADQSLFPSLDW